MNAMTPTSQQAAPRSPLDVFTASVLPQAKRSVVQNILPAHVKPDRFFRNFSIAVNQHPKLLNCDPAEVFNEISKAAALGLYLDPQLGEAYLITGFSNGKTVPQLRLGYRGLIKLARQSGEIKTIYAHEVHQFDFLDVSLGDEKRIIHKPNLTGDRGAIVLYYAVVKYTNGETDFEPMTLDQIYAIRDKSDGWKAFKAQKIKSTPWSTDEGEMAKKTVLRRLLKRIPQSPELADAQRHEDAAEGVIEGQVTNPALTTARPADQLRIEAQAPAANEPTFTIVETPEPEEVPAGEADDTKDGEQPEEAEPAERDPSTSDMFSDFPGDPNYRREA